MFCLAPAVQAQPFDSTISLQAHPGWVQVPGALIRPDCVYEVPNGAQLEENGDVILDGVIVAHHVDCPEAPIRTRPLHGVAPQFVDAPGTGNGWVEAVEEEVSLSSGDSLDKITGTWTVPKNPTVNGGLIYLFNGLEPTTQDLIIQPVLQYGANGLFGGNYWVMASWQVGKSAVHSPPVTVNVGDTISGLTQITSVSGTKFTWEIKIKDTTIGKYSKITQTTSGYTWNWAYSGVLEAYNITACGNFPKSAETSFQSTKVEHGFPSFKSVTPAWFGVVYSYGGPLCGFGTSIGASNDLYY